MLHGLIPELLRCEPHLAAALGDCKAVSSLLGTESSVLLKNTTAADELFSDTWMVAARTEAAERVVHADDIDCLMQRLVARVALELSVFVDEAALRIAGCDTYVFETSQTWCAWFHANDEGMTVHVTGPGPAKGTALTNELTRATRAVAYEKLAHAEPLPMIDFQTMEPAMGVMQCIGLSVSATGTVIAAMGKWGDATAPALGYVPVESLPITILHAERATTDGRWIALASHAPTLPVLCNCTSEFIAHLYIMSHVMNTGYLPPMCGQPSAYEITQEFADAPAFGADTNYASRGTFGQSRPARNVGALFTLGLPETLAQLRVYSEVPFVRMIKRFKAAGATDLNAIVCKWIAKRLPLLPGTLGPPGLCSLTMHKHAQMSVLSLRTRQRMWSRHTAVQHWVPSEIDPVLPSTAQEDADAMAALGLAAFAVEPALDGGDTADTATPDVADTSVKRVRLSSGSHTDYPVRVMLNASKHLSVLHAVVEDCKDTYNVEGAVQHFLQHEAPAIGQSLTRVDVERFRAACIRSALYGRVFLWMCIHTYSRCTSSDESGLLARTCPSVQTGVAWKGGWKPVGHLVRCAGASYVDCGCGSMMYWRQVLMGGWSSFLFEIDLTALQQLAANLSPLPDGVHIVPCDWTGLTLSDIVPHGPAVCAAYRPGSELPPVGTCTEAHYVLADCADYETVDCPVQLDFMAAHVSSRWRHRSNNAGAASKAALAQRMYMAT